MEQVLSTGSNASQLQQGLNEVVINKVRRMIDGKAAGVEATMNRLQEEGRIAQGVPRRGNQAHRPTGLLRNELRLKPDNSVKPRHGAVSKGTQERPYEVGRGRGLPRNTGVLLLRCPDLFR